MALLANRGGGLGLEQGEGQKPSRRREPTGELIGSYAVIAPIASGEATTVLLAQKQGALGFHRLAAIKRLKPAFAKNPEWTQLLLDEARLCAGVHHANIVDVVDIGTEGGTYLVMDYIEGADLDALLSRAGKERHPRYVLPAIVDALHGLHAVHTALDEFGESLAMVHQAPRARHILLGIDGAARLTDFSQVSARGLLPSHLRHGRLKSAYMAPEQLRGTGQVDPRTDLFILGITLWEALTGERLFQAETMELSRRAVLERHVPRPSDVGFKPPRALDRICLRALARDPAQRYASAEEMARDLRDVGLNEALYATSSELGQWVRALAGRALIERRHAIGADAPSLEIAIEAFENGPRSGSTPVDFSNTPTAVMSTERLQEFANTPTAVTSLPSAPERAPLPSEPSRVTRMYTVAVAAPPSPARSVTDMPVSALPLLGIRSESERRLEQRELERRFDPASARDELRQNGERPVRTSEPERRSDVLAAPSEPESRGVPRSRASEPERRFDPLSVTEQERRAGAYAPERREPAAPSPGAYHRIAPDRRGLTTLPERIPVSGEQADAQVRADERRDHVEPRAPAASARGALLLSSGEPAGASQPRLPGSDLSFPREPRGRPSDDVDGSLRPPNRAAHMDLPGLDDPPESSSGLGFIVFLSVAIIAFAAVVGFRQWSAERAGGGARPAASAAQPPQADEAPADAPRPSAVEAAPTTQASEQAAAAPASAEDAADAGVVTQAARAAAKRPAVRVAPKPRPFAAPVPVRERESFPAGGAPFSAPSAPGLPDNPYN